MGEEGDKGQEERDERDERARGLTCIRPLPSSLSEFSNLFSSVLSAPQYLNCSFGAVAGDAVALWGWVVMESEDCGTMKARSSHVSSHPYAPCLWFIVRRHSPSLIGCDRFQIGGIVAVG